MDNKKKLLETTIQIGQLLGFLLHSNTDCESQIELNTDFMDQIKCDSKVTNDCLIVQGSYDLPIFCLHTPFGLCQMTLGEGTGSHRKLAKELQQRLGLNLICPGYQTDFAYHGPCWLVTQFNDEPIPYPKIDLLPYHPDLDCCYDLDWQIANQYIRQKSSFYKSNIG